MNRCLLFSGLASVIILSACSSMDAKAPLGGFDYTKEKEGKTLVVPEHLKKPEKSTGYEVIEIPKGAAVGESMDIRSPSLVLPVAISSRVELGTNKAIVWFDQAIDDQELYITIKDALEKYLSNNGVALTALNEDEKLYESGWFRQEEFDGFWFFEKVSETTKSKYRFKFDVKPHGRSVSLTVNLTDFIQENESGTTNTVKGIDKQRFEMSVLNQVIEQVGYGYQKYYRDKRKERADQKLVSLSENNKAESSLLVEMTEDQLWDNINRFFVGHGFTVTDLDDSKKIYYVDYEKPSRSFWQFLWGDDVPVVDIESGDYHFRLREINDVQTYVTIYDKDGIALDSKTMENIYPVLEEGLSFRELL